MVDGIVDVIRTAVGLRIELAELSQNPQRASGSVMSTVGLHGRCWCQAGSSCRVNLSTGHGTEAATPPAQELQNPGPQPAPPGARCQLTLTNSPSTAAPQPPPAAPQEGRQMNSPAPINRRNSTSEGVTFD